MRSRAAEPLIGGAPASQAGESAVRLARVVRVERNQVPIVEAATFRRSRLSICLVIVWVLRPPRLASAASPREFGS